MAERFTVSEAHRAGVLSLPPSAYRVECEADVLLLLRDRGSAVAAFRVERTTRLPPGYRLELVGDPCAIVLVRADGTVVARFTHNVDPQEIRLAAEEDRQGTPEA
jgi:hypothetical protein